MYEDVDEALAALGARSQRKRYMVGLFPGVNESFLQRDAIREFSYLSQLAKSDVCTIAHEHFIATKHKCLDPPDLNPSDVRCCPYWYRCEIPDVEDGAGELESKRILILNLNYSIVLDEDCDTINKKVTVIYDRERLKPILRKLGAMKMTVYCPADLQDYPYAVVDFPNIARSRAGFQQLQGRCLGYSGRHLRVQYAPLHDYTFGGRHMNSADTREIIVVSMDPDQDQLRPGQTPGRKQEKSPGRIATPQKDKYSRMIVTKYGRRIQKPHNVVSGAFFFF